MENTPKENGIGKFMKENQGLLIMAGIAIVLILVLTSKKGKSNNPTPIEV